MLRDMLHVVLQAQYKIHVGVRMIIKIFQPFHERNTYNIMTGNKFAGRRGINLRG